jgi:hypothetical protein
MKTFAQLEAILAQELSELKELEQRAWLIPTTKRARKEQQIGRHCYEAEEDLGFADLSMLKTTLGLEESQWRTYKAKFIERASREH